jgi:hypothetical protein
MPSIAKIQKDLSSFDTYARKHMDNVPALQAKWKALFDIPLTSDSAKSFSTYYKTMVSKKNTRKSRSNRNQDGGNLAGAPLSYTMTPGANVEVYGRFPVEADTDPSTIRNLDVYFQDSLTKGCGTENSSLSVPVEMGSNQVGGKNRKANRKSRVNRKNSRKTLRKNRKATRTASHKNRKTYRRNRSNRSNRSHRGGDLMTSLTHHPYLSTVPQNMIQNTVLSAQGTHPSTPVSGNPTVQTWDYNSRGTAGTINPGLVTPIGNDFQRLASPTPWQTSN